MEEGQQRAKTSVDAARVRKINYCTQRRNAVDAFSHAPQTHPQPQCGVLSGADKPQRQLTDILFNVAVH